MAHDIDTFLLTKYFQNSQKTDQVISDALLKWFGALSSENGDVTRKAASSFLQELAQVHLRELHLPEEPQKGLIKIFEPLENIFRLALSLSEKGKMRDHLSHTIRNYLLSHFILFKINRPFNSHVFKILTIASIFHDISYPIEKFKSGTKEISDKLFKEYLDSRGVLDWELTNSANLLEILDIIGKSEHEGLQYIFKNIVAPAIAGEGLFNSPHCQSSVVLFLRHIINDWKRSASYWKTKSDEISNICLAMAFHDRKMFPKLDIWEKEAVDAIRALRIADELQEWGRDDEDLSFVNNVKVVESGKQDIFLHLEFLLKNRKDRLPFKPSNFIGDKLVGLIPVIDSEKIIITFKLPEATESGFQKSLFDHVVKTKFFNSRNEELLNAKSIKFLSVNEIGKTVNLFVNNKKAEVEVLT